MKWLLAVTVMLWLHAPVWCDPASTPAPTPTPAPILTLDQALQIASSQNRLVQASQFEIQHQQSVLYADKAQRLPKLSTTYRHLNLLTPINFNVAQGSLGNYPGVGPIPAQDMAISSARGAQSTVELTLTQPISQQHKLGLSIDVQDQEVRYAQESERNTQLSLHQQVCQVYLALVDTMNYLQATREALDFAKELERVTKEYLKEKTALKADLLDVQASRAQQEYQMQQLLHQCLLQKQQINYLLGRKLETDFQVSTPILSLQVNEALDQLQVLARDGRPDLNQAKARLKEALLNTEIERARYIPDISLQLNYHYEGNSGLLPGTIMFVGLVATWDVFDWGNREASIEGKSKQAATAQKQFEDAESQAALDVAQKFYQVSTQRALEPVCRTQLESAEEKYRVALARYQIKANLTKDLLQSQSDLATARRNYQKWQLDLALAVVQLYQSVGKSSI